jgi:uncharacterized protein (TIGR02266 family)
VDTELNRAESELLHEETSLHNELTRLLAIGDDLRKKIKTLKHAAAEAAAKGVGDEALTARLSSLSIPPMDTEAPFTESRAARQAAVISRRAATRAVRDRVAELKQALGDVTTQLQGEERQVKKLTSLAKRMKEAVGATDEGPVVELPPSPPPQAPPVSPRRFNPPIERQAPRVKMQAVIDLQSDNNFFNGFSSNISDGGIFVATVNLLPIGTPVELSFSLPAGGRIEAKGQVRWVREINDQLPDAFPGLGIQFHQLAPAAVDAISAFVSSREPMFYVE